MDQVVDSDECGTSKATRHTYRGTGSKNCLEIGSAAEAPYNWPTEDSAATFFGIYHARFLQFEHGTA